MQTNGEADFHGGFDPAWEPVVRAFVATVDPARGGAALAICKDGRAVVDVHAGTADVRDGRDWVATTPAVLFSATKGLAALTVSVLADRGQLDLDARVASVWPEFGQHGKDNITIGDVLAHRAGLPAPEGPLDLDDLIDNPGFAARLANQAPLWPDARAHLYHPVTWGPLVSEIVRRATGEEIGAIFTREIAQPLGAEVTLQPTMEQAADVAHVTNSPELEAFSTQTIPLLGDLAVAGLTAGGALPPAMVGDGTGLNDVRVLTSGLVSAAGVGTAMGLARVWSAAIEEPGLLSPAGMRSLLDVRSAGPAHGDPSDGSMAHRWGAGVQLASNAFPGLGASSFGHDGAGGQCAFADPQHRIGFAYVRNHLSHLPVVAPIIEATRRVLTGETPGG